MSRPFSLKKGDRLPSIRSRLVFSGGGLISASGVVFAMQHQTTDAIITGAAVIEDASDKVLTVRYDWGASDSSTVGTYNAEWVVTIGGKEMTFPPDGFDTVEVVDDVS